MGKPTAFGSLYCTVDPEKLGMPPQNRHSKRGKHLPYVDGPHSLDLDAYDYSEVRDLIMLSRRQHQRTNNLPLLQLPTEVLLQIFKYLDKGDLFLLLTVCRELSDLIVEILWFRPNMQSASAFAKIRQIMCLDRGATHWDYRKYIKRLNLLFMTSLVDDGLLALFAGCAKLERLTLVNCTKLTHAPITSVLEHCDRLQLIDMTGVQDVQDDIILALAAHCTRLQGLYAPGCGNILEHAIVTLLRACPMLKRVKFNNSDNVLDELILAMYENCKLLVEIDLHNCPRVTNKHLRRIFADLAQLREFRISKAPGVTDALFELVPPECVLEKLRIFDVSECNAITDALVERLVRCAPRLRNVVLSKCMQVTDALLRHLTRLGRLLHYLHLGHCGLITDFGVQHLVRLCHRIQYIDLACCLQLTDWTLVELLNLPKLRRIGLVKCSQILDQGITELVRRRGEQDCLERVHLSYCTNLTIGPIYYLLKNCPRLTHLSLTGILAFLRREITQYCREPPPDFTESQKQLFCVFSGHGVVQLRNYLDMLMEERLYFLQQHGFQEDVQDRQQRVFGVAGAAAPAERNPHNDMLRNIGFHEDSFANWAQQRGLGDFRHARDEDRPIAQETEAIVRQLLQQDQPQRFAPMYNPLETRAQERPGNAPTIVQAPVFVQEDVVMGVEDTEEEVDLFPRR